MVIQPLLSIPEGFPVLRDTWVWGSDGYVFYLLRDEEAVGGTTWVGGEEGYEWAVYGRKAEGFAPTQAEAAYLLAFASGAVGN